MMDAHMWALLGASMLLAGLMGFAIQRGATCTVAAVEELMTQRRARRLIALAEAALWVGLGLLLLRQLGWRIPLPAGHVAGWRTVVGGVLLGGGAYVNRACVFGAIAKWSNGDWAYVATPIGFFIGCALFWRVLQSMGALAVPEAAPALAWPGPWVWALALLLALRVAWGAARVWRRQTQSGVHAKAASPWHALGAAVWQPGPATVVIGLSFLGMMLMAGPWAYTELLNDWALNMPRQTWTRALLAAALFGGAAFGGWRAGKWARSRLQGRDVARCLIGGALMGCGSLLIPGGNDGLILVGMPLMWPYAWMAFGTMCVTISALMACQKLTQ